MLREAHRDVALKTAKCGTSAKSPREVRVEAGKSLMSDRALSGNHGKKTASKEGHGMAHRRANFTEQGPPLGEAVPCHGHRAPREGRPHCSDSKLRSACPVLGHLVAPHSWLGLEERVCPHFEATGAYFLPPPLSVLGSSQ